MIRFLAVDDVNRLHERTIEAHGGAPGIRDIGLLEAAVAMPMQTMAGEYLHEGMAEMAAAYLFHVCQAHAFVDGNKRAAVLAALTFLEINGAGLPDPVGLERDTLAVASGALTKREVASWFESQLGTGPTASS